MNIQARDVIRKKFQALNDHFDEKTRRLWAGTEAIAFGYGGATLVSDAVGLSLKSVRRGIDEVKTDSAPKDRLRISGGGRKKLTERDEGLQHALEKLVDPATRGDPECALRWTSKSCDTLSEELRDTGHEVSSSSVRTMLKHMGYTLQRTKKTLEGKQNIDRDAQFQYINIRAGEYLDSNNPIISIDTKKKEVVGNFSNSGAEWHKKGQPTKVNTHDFPSLGVGKAVPYGIYDVGRNEGWVSVGISKDTAEFATNAVLTWWKTMGKKAYPNATCLMMTADCGGSNGYRTRLWKYCIQKLANEIGLTIEICHFPPGTSKWNKIEHRLWNQVTKNWRGRPLVSFEVVVNLIGGTTTKSGLKVHAELDENEYKAGIKVTPKQFAEIRLDPHDFHGEWNYTILQHATDP